MNKAFRHPTVVFFVLAYTIAWLASVPLLVMERAGEPNRLAVIVFFTFSAVAPTLAAALMASATDGRAAIRDLMTRLLRWRVRPRWWLFALLYYPGAMLLGNAVLFAMVGTLDWRLAGSTVTYLPFWVLLAIVPILAILEEIGWRGYALPILQKQRSPLVASIIIGGLWGGWHLPAFFLEGMPQSTAPFVPYVVLTILLAIWLTWLYNHTQSILLVAVFHSSINYTGLLLGPPQEPVVGAVFGGCALLLTIILIVGDRMAKRRISPADDTLPVNRSGAA